MRSDIFIILGVSLLLTLLLELAFSLLAGLRGAKVLCLVALVNALTNPPVVLLYTLFPTLAAKILLEVGAVLIEGLIYRKCAPALKRPYLFSLGANAFSYFVGAMLGRLV